MIRGVISGSFLKLVPNLNPPYMTGRSSERKKKNKLPEDLVQPQKPLFYLYITGGGFLVTVVLFVGIIIYRNNIDAVLTDRAYYIVLFSLAFSSAAFLFGVMNSYAKFSHKTFHGSLHMGGPVVIAFLVIYGGYKLHGDTDFYYTVNVKPDPKIGRSKSYPAPGGMTLRLQLEDDTREGNLNKEGFDFKRIAGEYRNQKVGIVFTAKYWKSAVDSIELTHSSQVLYIEPDGSLAEISGMVQDAKGNPVPYASVNCLGITDSCDSKGNYTIHIPPDRQTVNCQVTASFHGHSGLAQVSPATGTLVNIYLPDYYIDKK